MKQTFLLLLTMNLFSLFARAEPLTVGTSAPKITAKNQDAQDVIFGDVYTKGITLVYFYPKAETPGCTKEACSLRDSYATLHGNGGNGLQILGVSRDTPEAQKKFKDHQNLPFTLIADTDQKVADAFAVPHLAGFDHRQSFLVKDGKIAWLDLKASTKQQAADVLKAAAGLGATQ